MLFGGVQKMVMDVYQFRTSKTPVTISPGTELIHSVWDINSSVNSSGQNFLVLSALNANSLNNNGWIIDTQNSNIDISGNLTGTGQITELGSSMTIAGSGSASETLVVANGSQLYLNSPSFGSLIDLDSTSAIHIDTPAAIASVVGNLTANGAPYEALPFHGLFNVKSITPGYTPEAEFTFAGSAITGVTIVDKPTPPDTASTIRTIVGSTVSDPNGAISATDGSVVVFNSASTPSGDTISLDSTSTLSIGPTLGMNFLASIDMVAGSTVQLSTIQGDLTSITEYPQLNLVDFFAGSTLEAQLHIHNESPGTTIWATQTEPGRGPIITLSDSISKPTVNFPNAIPLIAIPIHVIG
jgi:hypothetical protein